MFTIIFYITLYLFINAIPAFFVAINAAKRKMRSALWFVIVSLSSLIGIAVYIIVKDPIVDEWIEDVNIEIPEITSSKICPKCSAFMNDDEKICGLCGYEEKELV